MQLIKRMLSEPGRYEINVFPDAKPYIYKTDIDFILKEDDQLNCQLLGRFIQTIFTLWEKLKIEQSVFHELRDDIVVTNLETSITAGRAARNPLSPHLRQTQPRFVLTALPPHSPRTRGTQRRVFCDECGSVGGLVSC